MVAVIVSLNILGWYPIGFLDIDICWKNPSGVKSSIVVGKVWSQCWLVPWMPIESHAANIFIPFYPPRDFQNQTVLRIIATMAINRYQRSSELDN